MQLVMRILEWTLIGFRSCEGGFPYLLWILVGCFPFNPSFVNFCPQNVLFNSKPALVRVEGDSKITSNVLLCFSMFFLLTGSVNSFIRHTLWCFCFKDQTLRSYVSHGVLKVAISMASGYCRSWWYPGRMSSLENTVQSWNLYMNSSTIGSSVILFLSMNWFRTLRITLALIVCGSRLSLATALSFGFGWTSRG